MSESTTCPQCAHTADQNEFEEHVGDSPDLVGSFCCPECDHFWDDSES